METKKIKIVIPVFALLLATIASLSFTSINDIAEDCPVTRAWYHHGPDEMCILVKPVSCDDVDQDLGLCTVTILGNVKQLYGNEPNGSCANVILYKCIP